MNKLVTKLVHSITTDHFRFLSGENNLKGLGQVRLTKVRFKQFMTSLFGASTAEKM
jgi:hypothetical protein